MQQLRLFEVEKHFREVREMSRVSIMEAAQTLVSLLDRTPVVSFDDIVRQKMQLADGGIPVESAKDFVEQRDAVYDERLRIKEAAELTDGRRMAVIDRFGRPALRGGDPAAFILDTTEAGALNGMALARMQIGGVKATIRREAQAGRLTLQERDEVLGNLEEVAGRLLPTPPQDEAPTPNLTS